MIPRPTQLNEAFQTLLNGFAKLEMLSSAIRSAALHEHQRLQRNERELREIGHEGLAISVHSMSYRDIQTNAPIFYDSRERGVNDLTEDLISYRNKQYQWVLVEAFELFEDFVEYCYSECIRMNPDGPTTKSKGDLTAKLKMLRTHLPNLGISETNNARQINYRSAIALVEMLRHIVVHNGGWIKDEAKFFEKLNWRVHKGNAGKHDSGIDNYAKFFLSKGRHGIEVYLLEEADKKPSSTHTDRLSTLLGWLLTYSSCLKDHLSRVSSLSAERV